MKMLKPVLITTLVMAAVAGSLVFLLTRTEHASVQKMDEITDAQRDVSKQSEYRFDIPKDAVKLKKSGDDKNVLNFDSKDPYHVKTSDAARQRLDRLIQRMNVTFDQPVIAADPFGTNKNSYYFYFQTEYSAMVRYTVMVEDESIPDFTRYVNNGKEKNLTKIHEFTVSGLVPGMTNYIRIQTVDAKGQERAEKIYSCEVPKSDVKSKINTKEGYSAGTCTLGLYYVFPSDKKSIYAYDNSGILRNITVTEGAHGKRIYETDNAVLYQISKTKVARVSAIGRVTGVAEIKGYGEIRDFSYDGYDNIFALVRKNGKDMLVSASIQGGSTKKVFEFPKGIRITSITAPSGGVLYASAESPNGLICLSGVSGVAPKVSFVTGKKNAWKKTVWKKKVNEDKTAVNWNLKSVLLNADAPVSDKSASLTTYLFDKGRGNAISFEINDKKIKTDITFPVGKSGVCCCQKIDDHWIISTLSRGDYEEYDAAGNVTRRFAFGSGLDGVVKLALNGMCFYIG